MDLAVLNEVFNAIPCRRAGSIGGSELSPLEAEDGFVAMTGDGDDGGSQDTKERLRSVRLGPACRAWMAYLPRNI